MKGTKHLLAIGKGRYHGVSMNASRVLERLERFK